MNDIPDSLKKLLDESGVEVSGHREIDHATQYTLSREHESATLNVYHTNKVSVGGKSSDLKRLLEGWRLSQTGLNGRGEGKPVLDSTPRLGIDESGKGDYFGPLVVAGVRITGEKTAANLERIGVRDSKKLGAAQATRLAELILEAVGEENVCVRSLAPGEYETRRSSAGNINRLLVELDSEVMDKLEDEVEVILVDEFARSARSSLEPFVPEGVWLEVRPRAEDDAAVAAASILARARQLEELGRLSELVEFDLPRGATHVEEAARRVVGERGMGGLRETAKVSFATTERALGDKP